MSTSFPWVASEPGRFLLLVTGPSGAGKSSLLEPVLAGDPRLDFSISCTTRPPRSGEKDGREYHFVSEEKFRRQREAGAFVEWAEVHAHLYGTRCEDIEAMMAEGRIPVLDVDVQGGRNILDHYGERVVSVFIFPPSWEDLELRLRGRKTDDEETVQRRLRNARSEVAQASAYSYWLVNDDLERARTRLRAIVLAESLHRSRFPGPILD